MTTRKKLKICFAICIFLAIYLFIAGVVAIAGIVALGASTAMPHLISSGSGGIAILGMSVFCIYDAVKIRKKMSVEGYDITGAKIWKHFKRWIGRFFLPLLTWRWYHEFIYGTNRGWNRLLYSTCIFPITKNIFSFQAQNG